MAQDYFKGGRQSTEGTGVGGVFNGNDVRIGVGSAGGEGGLQGALVQQIQVQYQRAINRVQEIGSEFVYYIVGKAQGSASLQNIVGPSNAVQEMLDKLTDACQVQQNTMYISATQKFCATADGISDTSDDLSFELTGPILTSIGITMSVSDMTIMSQASVEFATLSKG